MNHDINAQQAVKLFGKILIGRQVITEAIGAWPGGLCKVISLSEDANAPEIVLNVKRLEDRTTRMEEFQIDDECGIFEYEDITIIDADDLVKANA